MARLSLKLKVCLVIAEIFLVTACGSSPLSVSPASANLGAGSTASLGSGISFPVVTPTPTPVVPPPFTSSTPTFTYGTTPAPQLNWNVPGPSGSTCSIVSSTNTTLATGLGLNGNFTPTLPYPANGQLVLSYSLNCGGQIYGPVTITLPAPQDHLIFVSSVPVTGNMGGLGGADAKCTQLATAAALRPNATWKAVLTDSGTSSIAQRITFKYQTIRNMNGDLVFTPATFYANGGPILPVRYMETGFDTSVSNGGGIYVWTGTNPTGQNTNDCNNNNNNSGWIQNSGAGGVVGLSTATDKTWTDLKETDCSGNYSLYCISQ